MTSIWSSVARTASAYCVVHGTYAAQNCAPTRPANPPTKTEQSGRQSTEILITVSTTFQIPCRGKTVTVEREKETRGTQTIPKVV